MRVAHDLLKSVAFLGRGTPFKACGTAFLLIHQGMVYLVTAKHVAKDLGEDPFHIRFNNKAGGSSLLPVDLTLSDEPRFRWFTHQSASVDLAVIPFPISLGEQGVVAVALQSAFTVADIRPITDAGCGDICHVIGLFASNPGKNRNVAVVHTGHIAAMYDESELVEVKNGQSTELFEGYLVELSNLPGLSGAPVFVRGGLELDVPTDNNGTAAIVVATPQLKLLGVWQGSWDTGVSTARSTERVPIGMGVVTPAYRLIELLDSPEVSENRSLWTAAVQD